MQKKFKYYQTYIWRNHKKVFRAMCLILFMELCLLFLVASSRYNKYWYPHSVISGVDVSGMTLEESEKYFQKYIDEYSLKINGRNDGTDTITGKEIELSADLGKNLKACFDKQHEKTFLSAIFNSESYKNIFDVTYNEELFNQRYASSILVTGSDSYKITAPQDAHLGYSSKDGLGKVLKEKQGNTLNEENAKSAIKSAMTNMLPEIDLADKTSFPDVYEQPPHEVDSSDLKDMLADYNSYLLHWINLKTSDGQPDVQLTPNDIAAWISADNSSKKVSIKEQPCKEWIEQYCLARKTVGLTRTFTTHSGNQIEVKDGDYGWRVDYDAMCKSILDLLREKPDEKTLNAYIEKPNDETRAPLIEDYNVEYSSKAFTYDPNNPAMDWDTNNYSEVDLTEQTVYVYKDGKQVYECPTVSGLPVEGRETRTGCFAIKDKKETYTLTGEDYSVPTKYWVRITWSGTGYHYMERSDWDSWSPSVYKSRGSHGCLNLQLADAKSIYNLVKMNDIVFIHK